MVDDVSTLIARARTYAELQAKYPDTPLSAVSLVSELADALQWADHQEALDDDKCMNPRCMAKATQDVNFWGRRILRSCDGCVPDIIARRVIGEVASR